MTMTISPDPSSHPSIKSFVRSMIQSPIKSPQPAISQPSASPGQNTILRAILLSCTAIIEKSHNPPATPKTIVENEQKPITQKNPRKRKANGRPAATSRSVAAAATPAQNKDGETRKATRNRLAIVHSSRLPRCQGRKKRSEPGVARCHILAALVAFLPSLCRA